MSCATITVMRYVSGFNPDPQSAAPDKLDHNLRSRVSYVLGPLRLSSLSAIDVPNAFREPLTGAHEML